jgi:hypothetical protein
LIIEEASKVTTSRGSRKVEAYHLCVRISSSYLLVLLTLSLASKHAVDTTEMLDFLKEIVQSVPDPSAGGTIDLEAEAAAANAKKKRGKAKKEVDPNAPPKKRRTKKADEPQAEEPKSEPEQDDVQMNDDDDEPMPSRSTMDDDDDWDG